MLKLMKYEWRKQWFSKAVMLGILALLVITFVISSHMEKESGMVFSIFFMMIAIFLFTIFTGIEAITTFHRDLKSRQSYLLLMIPQPAWKMLAAKVITALISMLFVGFASALSAVLCFLHEIGKDGAWHELWEGLSFFFKFMLEEIPDPAQLIPPLLSLFFSWFFLVMLAFLSDIIIMTLFSTFKKGAGFLGAVLFLLLWFGSSRLLNVIVATDEQTIISTAIAWKTCLYYAVLSIGLFLGTSWLTEHRLSV